MSVHRRLVLWVFGGVALLVAAQYASAASGIDPFVKMRWPASATLAHDGTLYFIYNPEGIYQLYKVPPGRSQGDAVKLTTFEDGIGAYNLSEDGKWIAITASVGGSEQADLFLMNAATGTLETLFSDPNIVYGSVTWRRDSKAFAYRANDKVPSDFYVYVYDLATRKATPAYQAEGYYYPAGFDSTGHKLAVGRYVSPSQSQVFEVDLTSGASHEITPTGETWSFEPIGYGPDDRHFFVNSNYHRDLHTVFSLDTANGKLTPVLSDLDGYEVDFAQFDFARKVLAVTTNEDGYADLHLRDAKTYAPVDQPKMDRGLVGNVAFTGDEMLYSLTNANTPGTIYRWDRSRPSAAPVAVTEPDTQGIDVSRFRLPKLVHYKSFDRKEIPAFVYLPPDYKAGTKIPFIAYYHGGPESQFRPGFVRTFQYFLSKGYGLIAPNVRGSAGYGKAYIEADNYKNRYKSVKDGVWAVKYVIDQGYTVPKMVGAWGGSYGGFMVMATITEAPELYGAACDVVGIVNFQTFLEQTKAYRRKLREAEYGPLSDPEFLKSISPLYKVDRIDTPLMLAHGLNDPRVPIGEAMQVAVALKKRGKVVEELYFPDEGHGFAKEENRLLYYDQLAKFFDEYLKN